MAVFIPRFLRHLRDVDETGVADGDSLTYDSGTETWVPAAGGGGGGPPTGAAGGVLGGTYPNPGFAADMATQAELDAIAAGAVILAPASSARNVIQPTAGTVIAAIIKAHAAQSVDLMQWQDSTGAVFARVTDAGGLRITPLTEDGATGYKDAIVRISEPADFSGASWGTHIAGLDHNGEATWYFGAFYRNANSAGGQFLVRRTNFSAPATIEPYVGAYPGSFFVVNDGASDALSVAIAPNELDLLWRVNQGGYMIVAVNSVPADGVLVAGELASWFDATNGAAKLMHKGKTANGTVVTFEQASGVAYVVGGTDVALADGGTGASLADPGADRIMFWDDSAGAVDWLTAGTGLTITGTQIDASASGAPSTATYITQTADAGLSAEQALSALATGLVKNTTGTGVLSIGAAGTDYYAPGGTDVAVADGGTGASSAVAARANLGSATRRNSGYRVGQYYYGECIAAGGLGGTGANATGTCYFVPFIVDVTTTFDRVACYITANATAGGLARMGIYNDNAGVPGTLLLDAGTVATDAGAPAIKAITISQQLVAGTYWLAVVSQVAAATVRRNIPLGTMQWLSTDFNGSAVVATGITGAFADTPIVNAAIANPTTVALRALSSP